MKNGLFALALIAIIGVGCKKESTSGDGGGTTDPSVQILGKWFGDEQSLTVNITGAGPLDTTFTETEPIPWLRLTFNSDGTGQSDSLGFDADQINWEIKNNNLLVVDGTDTLMITKLNSTGLHLGISETDYSTPPMVLEINQTSKFTR